MLGWAMTWQNWENMQISAPLKISLVLCLNDRMGWGSNLIFMKFAPKPRFPRIVIFFFQNEIARRRRERTHRRQSQRRNRQRYWNVAICPSFCKAEPFCHIRHVLTVARFCTWLSRVTDSNTASRLALHCNSELNSFDCDRPTSNGSREWRLG